MMTIFETRPSVMAPSGRALLAAALVGLLTVVTACERPFEEADRPRIDVLEPDLSIIRGERQPQLSIRVTSNVGIIHVVAGEDTLAYDEALNAWRGRHVLTNGLNRIVFAVTDEDLRTTFDTTYTLIHTLMVSQAAPHLQQPRGGHSASLLEDGTILLIGGAPSASAPAYASGVLLREGSPAFEPMENALLTARSGHTATTLPDGRILIIGGADRDAVESLDDLVEAVEIYDPLTGIFSSVPVDGRPIRRSHHTATLHLDGEAVYVDLYGGTGDISYSSPTLGIRADVRRFQHLGDTLVALDPAPGPRLNEELTGHAQIELYPNALGVERFHLSGARFDASSDDNVSVEIDYVPELGILQNRVAPLHEARTRHAAALLTDGFVGLFGGLQGSPLEGLTLTEIYSSIAKRSFIYEETGIALPRYGHTATKVRNERIRLFGGFLPSGEGITASELFSAPLFDGGLTGTGGR